MSHSGAEGLPEPLGVTLTAGGVNVAVHAPDAWRVEFCLFDGAGEIELRRVPLAGRTGSVFHAHIGDVTAGARYGLRAYGPFDPARGLRFNPNKLLVDPFALALDRAPRLHPSMFDAPPGGAEADAWEADSGPYAPKAVVNPQPQPASPPPSADWSHALIYELHVKGFTATHPDVPDRLRGTFAGLAHPAAIDHLKRLGVSVVELMPCSAWIDERHLPPLGLTNYWGYNPIALCAPDPRLAPGGWAEVRQATAALAEAGIGTVLDVVLNHTGEGDDLGPTLSLRGLDNAGYYRLRSGEPARYVDDAGTGNVLALDRPAGVRLAMDSLRAWRRYGGVGGFRFDLATVLGRREGGFDPDAPLLSAIRQDPELRELMLIAEPWDIGPGGYQLGRFAEGWGEWNDRFRDSLRGFWRGDQVSLGELARRLSGSQDLFGGRRPSRSINFVTAHDGFTLADLVAFETKHNDANGEAGRDGSDRNLSWNNGPEGASTDPQVLAARAKDVRSLLACLLLARGTPMLSMGDELGRTQGGNNNSYAQDNAVSWVDWASKDEGLLAFARRLVAIRGGRPAFSVDLFLSGVAVPGHPDPDVAWRKADGAELSPAEWDDPLGRTLVMVLAAPTEGGLDRVVLALHRGDTAERLVLPEPRDEFGWTLLCDSADDARHGLTEEEAIPIAARSVLVLAETPASRRRSRPVDPEVLTRLASAAGIAPEWWTVRGERHVISPDTHAALLAAMQLPAATTRQAVESLHGLAEAHDRRATPFFAVLGEAQPRTIRLPVRSCDGGVDTWLQLQDERGGITRVRASDRAGRETEIVCRDGRHARALELELPPLPAGRYRVTREDAPDVAGRLTIAPRAGYLPPSLDGGRRAFGVAAQLYSIARANDQGVGDFTTLGMLGEGAAGQGAAMLAVNPLHALFNDRRDRASPYYPSDRRFLDPIHLDLEGAHPGGQPGGMIDYPGVWAAKAEALHRRYAAFQGDPTFAAFVAAEGRALEDFAAFQAISETRPGTAWRDWPEDLRDPDGDGVRRMVAARADRVRFHMYLQWLCEQQLAKAADRASRLAVGFCRDLAVGAAPDGAEAWSNAGLLARGVWIGAPPDPIAPQGQVWGLPPYDPNRMRENGYVVMADLFARNMRHAGALRIDHVMGLARQFWVPDGASGGEGAYVAYPLQDLLGELALESARAQCVIVGEDLGTVPPGLRETLNQAQVLSYRVLSFERDAHGLKSPEAYPDLACACVSTHDLPPLAGWWEGRDIEERRLLGLMSPGEADDAVAERGREKLDLIAALSTAGLAVPDQNPDGRLSAELTAAIHCFIARTPSIMALVQVDDLTGEEIAVNLPGTDMERPNWRRRISRPAEQLFEGDLAGRILDALRTERPRPAPGASSLAG